MLMCERLVSVVRKLEASGPTRMLWSGFLFKFAALCWLHAPFYSACKWWRESRDLSKRHRGGWCATLRLDAVLAMSVQL